MRALPPSGVETASPTCRSPIVRHPLGVCTRAVRAALCRHQSSPPRGDGPRCAPGAAAPHARAHPSPWIQSAPRRAERLSDQARRAGAQQVVHQLGVSPGPVEAPAEPEVLAAADLAFQGGRGDERERLAAQAMVTAPDPQHAGEPENGHGQGGEGEIAKGRGVQVPPIGGGPGDQRHREPESRHRRPRSWGARGSRSGPAQGLLADREAAVRGHAAAGQVAEGADQHVGLHAAVLRPGADRLVVDARASRRPATRRRAGFGRAPGSVPPGRGRGRGRLAGDRGRCEGAAVGAARFGGRARRREAARCPLPAELPLPARRLGSIVGRSEREAVGRPPGSGARRASRRSRLPGAAG